MFTRYDARNKTAEFRNVTQAPGSDPVLLEPDPSDPTTHRLPVVAGASIKSIAPEGFPFETCPPAACPADDMMDSVLGHNPSGFFANIHVNAADQIDTVEEMAY
jgi:hypothetical protein